MAAGEWQTTLISLHAPTYACQQPSSAAADVCGASMQLQGSGWVVVVA